MTGVINLSKGQRINLSKSDGSELTKFCVGANWGAIVKKGWISDTVENVDLDLSIVLLDENNKNIDTCYFGRKSIAGVLHSGDDRTGDVGGDDGLDNEVITVDLMKIDPRTRKVAVILNSFQGHFFGEIPYAGVRVFEGTPERPSNIIASFKIENEPAFKTSKGLILASLYLHEGKWKARAIGHPVPDSRIDGTMDKFVQMF